MASEIRVNKIENRSGLGTVTFADTGVDLAGIVTATTFSGSGASLTNVPDSALSSVTASKLSGALPAISAASLTNVPAANVVGVHTSLTVTNATTTGTAVVGGGVTISESGIEASGIGITCANINGTQIGGRRNLVINGAMNIAQRGTSSTSTGYQTVDRFQIAFDSGLTEAPTQAQVALTSSDTPYSLGLKYAFRITNGNQTSQSVNDYIHLSHSIEAQDIAQSGWNYTSTSGFITLSFWVKASTAQTMYVKVGDSDASRTLTFAFSATTSWTRIIKTIPGNSNLVFNNDNGVGLQIVWVPYYGTNYTTSSHTNDAWNSDDGADQLPDMANTWFSANDATFDITGVQLEVGPQATAFEHRSFGEELSLCERYFQAHVPLGSSGTYFCSAYNYTSSAAFGVVYHRTRLRTAPTLKQTTGTDYYVFYRNGSGDYFDSFESFQWSNGMTGNFRITSGISGTAGHAGAFYTSNSSAYVAFDSEL